MKCSSMVSIAAFHPRDPGSNPGWFAVSNSNSSMDRLVHQYVEIWSRSTWHDRSHCSTSLLESSRLESTPFTGGR